MNELVKTIDELYAAFRTDAELQAGKITKLQDNALVKCHWN